MVAVVHNVMQEPPFPAKSDDFGVFV